MSTFNGVLEASRGRWSEIVAAFCGNALEEAIATGGRKHVNCPVHGESSNKPFRVFKDFEDTGGVVCSHCGNMANGIDAISWVLNENPVKVRNEIADYLGIDEKFAEKHESAAQRKPASVIKMPVTNQASNEAEAAKSRTKAQKLWSEARPLSSTKIATGYLASRGLWLDPKAFDLTFLDSSIRLHPSVEYWEADDNGQFKLIGHFPCLLSCVFNYQGQIVSMHRTYLKADGSGKADVACAKKLVTPFGDMSGACIALAKPARSIAICEGLETGMAVQVATGLPTLATVSAPLMMSFRPPEGVQKVSIFADLDASETGIKVATELKGKLEANGISARILLPFADLRDRKSVDFLDVMNEYGSSAIRYQAGGA